MDSLKRNYYLGFSKTTAIPSLEKVSEIKADGKPFSPPPPWQLQDNEPAASAWSLRQTPPTQHFAQSQTERGHQQQDSTQEMQSGF